ncbi:MAG: MFS transporter, partial [Geminicoccaceae bacterium]|nr:MFS transporter [Geminicoccaceae bacterium]
MADARRLRNLQMAFREAAYARYVAGNSVSLVGNWMQRTATGWLAWDLTGSSAWLGIVAFADLFPALLIGPVGGVLADRHDRRLLMLAFQSAMFAVAILLWLAAGAGMLGIHLLLVLTTLHGVLVGLNQPARLSLIPQLVRGDLIGPAIAINSMVFNGARFIGPAIAGLIIATFGTSWAFFVNALTYIPFLLALSTIRPIPDERHATRAPFLTQIAEGIRYVFDNQGIR